MAEMKVGQVTHYYDKLGVAVVELTATLAVGDKIKFTRGGEDLFTQTVSEIQMEHKSIDQAGSGQAIGLKIDQEVKSGAEVYKIT